MVDLQIKMLYGSYGWSVAEIAKFLDLPESGVRMYLEEGGLLAAPCPVELLPYQDKGDNPALVDAQYASGMRDLKRGAMAKELSIAPIMAAIELSLLGKVMEAAESCEPQNTNQLASIVNTFKALTRDSLINVAVKADESNKGTQVQVNVPVMVFRD